VITVRVAVRMFRRTEWQARELSRLSGHVLETQEQMLHRFARELHDEFGQSLTAIEANLAAVPVASPEVSSRIEDCSLLVKDLMSNVRELSQLLRPSTLDDFGLKPSLQLLAESFAQRTGISINSRLDFSGRVPGEIETHLFRIAQEALTNVARHSKATRVDLSLEKRGGVLRLSIADNGGGIKSKPKPDRGGLGLAGMRERMRVAGGQLEVRSDSQGVTVVAEVALDEAAQRAETHPSLVGG
jgi:signal transduction histidine kinase